MLNVIYGSFAIEGGQVYHREGVLKIGPVEQKMVEVIVKKSKESEYAKGFNLKVDDVFSDEVKKEILTVNRMRQSTLQ